MAINYAKGVTSEIKKIPVQASVCGNFTFGSSFGYTVRMKFFFFFLTAKETTITTRFVSQG